MRKIQGKRIASKRKSRCKGPETDMRLVCSQAEGRVKWLKFL